MSKYTGIIIMLSMVLKNQQKPAHCFICGWGALIGNCYTNVVQLYNSTLFIK